jgi:hypothetical protein
VAVAAVAEAVAVAAVAEAAVAEAVAEAAVAEAVAEAVAAAVAVAAIFQPETYKAAAEAAKKERLSSQSWGRQFDAARAVFRKAIADSPIAIASPLRAMRDRHDEAFGALLLQLCAMT